MAWGYMALKIYKIYGIKMPIYIYVYMNIYIKYRINLKLEHPLLENYHNKCIKNDNNPGTAKKNDSKKKREQRFISNNKKTQTN
jgi:hypothetical protein